MTACVYLVKATNSDGLHKIGKTINIQRRMRELKVLPENQVLVIELPDETIMHRVEQILHNCFDDVRIPQSEMFNLTPTMLQACIEKMQAFQSDHIASMEQLDKLAKEEERLERERWFALIDMERERKERAKARRREAKLAKKIAKKEAEIAALDELYWQRLDEEAEEAERKRQNWELIKKQLKRLIPSWSELLLFLASAWLFALTGQDILLNSFLIACVWVTLKWAARKIQKGPDIRS